MGGGGQRLLAALETQRAGDAGEPGAEGEHLDVGSRVRPAACASFMLSSVRPFIEPETSIRQQHLARPGAPLQASEPQHLAVVAHALAQGAAQIGPRAAAGAHAAMPAPPRQSGQGLARESAQGVAGRACREAAFDQRFGAGGDKSGLVGFVGQQRFVLAASFLLQANHFLIFRARVIDRFAADEMDVEQPVVGRAPLGRRGERRQSCEADGFHAARAQQLDRGEECRCLFRRHGKTVDTQQRDKGHEARGPHAAAEVRRSRGRLRNQGVEPAGDEGEIFLVLQRNADRALEGIRPAGAALVQQRGRFG